MLDVDGNGNPMITIVKDCEDSFPGDVRDTLVGLFFEKFGHVSNYLTADFSTVVDGKRVVYIKPVSPEEMGRVAEQMKERFDLLKNTD